jgi:hypothetical protein
LAVYNRNNQQRKIHTIKNAGALKESNQMCQDEVLIVDRSAGAYIGISLRGVDGLGNVNAECVDGHIDDGVIHNRYIYKGVLANRWMTFVVGD